ncbi:hypothetical protein PtB15_2B486 [Puccinia triticina]|nr:hypothetical protein PtB15_2B486 [Puccinia triticina]
MCNRLGGNDGLKNLRQGTQQGFADQSRSGKPCHGLYNQILRLATPASVFLIDEYGNKHNPKYLANTTSQPCLSTSLSSASSRLGLAASARSPASLHFSAGSRSPPSLACSHPHLSPHLLCLKSLSRPAPDQGLRWP